MAAHLLVERNAPRDMRVRYVFVKVDGRQVGRLDFGERVLIPLEPGHHEIVFDNTWAKKRVDLEAEDGAEYAAQVGNTPGFLFKLWIAILAAGPQRLFVNFLRVDRFMPAPVEEEPISSPEDQGEQMG